jgi:hypothetical protein
VVWSIQIFESAQLFISTAPQAMIGTAISALMTGISLLPNAGFTARLQLVMLRVLHATSSLRPGNMSKALLPAMVRMNLASQL